jgi:asparagine synthase (glutamine-hydrolysing)
MCGIAGIYNHLPGSEAQSDILKQMLAQIHYRGPDECGILSAGNVTMGNVRLNIIDLAGGTQPISDQSGNYWIVFNGEIFNYLELREELENKGLRFTTKSDTEVLVQLYALYGTRCLEKLNGQFAFAIWDKKSGELFLARDRVGIRPLYYSWQKGTFLFGSEVKAILEHPDVKPEINVKALRQIFTFWAPLTPGTIFNNIYELPPGHFMLVKNKKTEIKRYWELDYSKTIDYSLPEAMEKFEEIFNDAVKLRLRSDVPVAAYLSGGIDSTVTTRFIKDIQPQNLQTFSIGFEEAQFDETNYQDEASRYLQTDHKRFICNNKDIGEYFSKVIWHAEVPVIRTAPAPMYFLSRLVRENDIKVVITGEGADEMLAGYNIFKEAIIRQFWAKDPDSRLRPLLLKKLYPYIPYIRNASPGMLKMFFGYQLNETNSPFYSHLIRWNNTSRIGNYLSKDSLNGFGQYDPVDDVNALLPANFNQWTQLSKAQWLEINLFMSGYLLSSQGDRMAMANSVEGRYPFLDHRLIEFSASIPDKFKLNGLTEKYLLKKVMLGKLPERIVKRPKQAYRAPISHMINGAGSSEQIRNILSTDKVKSFGLFDPGKVDGLKQKYSVGKNISEIDDMALIGMISTQLLYDQFIRNNDQNKADVSVLNVKKHVKL